MRSVTARLAEGGRRIGARSEWLILCRWGRNGRFLSVSCAGSAPLRQATCAPMSLRPRVTLVGRLAWDDARSGEACFLLTGPAPPSVSLAGRFIEAQGFLMLLRRGGRLMLAGTFRAGGCATARRLEARQHSWPGEYFAGP
jgi:hypothetical protein